MLLFTKMTKERHLVAVLTITIQCIKLLGVRHILLATQLFLSLRLGLLRNILR